MGDFELGMLIEQVQIPVFYDITWCSSTRLFTEQMQFRSHSHSLQDEAIQAFFFTTAHEEPIAMKKRISAEKVWFKNSSKTRGSRRAVMVIVFN